MLRPASTGLRFRAACPGDAHAIAGLHAESWQRHYRGAYSDAFLDNDATGYLRPLWTERLAIPNPQARTILAEHDGAGRHMGRVRRQPPCRIHAEETGDRHPAAGLDRAGCPGLVTLLRPVPMGP